MIAQVWRKLPRRLQKFRSMLILASMTGAGTRKMLAWVRRNLVDGWVSHTEQAH